MQVATPAPAGPGGAAGGATVLGSPSAAADLELGPRAAAGPAGAAASPGLGFCRRRAPRAGSSRAYEGLLATGRAAAASGKGLRGMAFWSRARAKSGADVFVLAPPEEAAVDIWSLLAFCAGEMHERVVEQDRPYVVVWLQVADHKVWPYSAWRFLSSLHKKYGELLESLHVVHPSDTLRTMSFALWPVVSESVWDWLLLHERVDFLSEHLDVGQLELPEEVTTFDAFLDRVDDLHGQAAVARMAGY
ncbi:unnamed protein product [Prorocentrum cordatum]|uniref:CRAL-TRIO domain-containing protein n=1 Tax=Prorocentrum cordatum TaxID=2364126 RepID=A0ABN9SC90_9DINO|nr:unnamed protein product [Polarella glacialis]